MIRLSLLLNVYFAVKQPSTDVMFSLLYIIYSFPTAYEDAIFSMNLGSSFTGTKSVQP